MELIGLIGSLKTHEMKRKVREEKAPQKKKTLVFKSSHTISEEEEEDDQEDDEDLSLLIKNMRRMYNKAKLNNCKRWQGKEDKKLVCYNCRKPGHIVVNCPESKSKPTTSKKPNKKKVLKAT